jgi:hypothetical protein
VERHSRNAEHNETDGRGDEAGNSGYSLAALVDESPGQWCGKPYQ